MTTRNHSTAGLSFVARLCRLLFSFLAGWGTLVLGHAGSVQAQDVVDGGLLTPPGGVVAGEGAKVRALVLEQVKRVPSHRGPGKSQSVVETRQLLIIGLQGRKLYMADYDRDEKGEQFLRQHIQVRLDKETPRVYTLTPDGRRYTEHSGDLINLQHERDIAESNEIKLGNRLPRREREDFFRRNCHLRSDGLRVVKLSVTKGEQVQGRDCERVVLKENCLTIIDAQVAKSVPGAANYYHLYRRLGVFSEEVLEQLKDLKGVPLAAKINVVTALKNWPMEIETKKIWVDDVPIAFFELPANAEEYVENAGPEICPMCKKEIEPETGVQYFESDNRKLLFCSESCADEYETRFSKSVRGRP